MHMRVEQAVRQARPTGALDRLCESADECTPVVVVVHDRYAGIAPCDRVVNATGDVLAQPPSHGERVARQTPLREMSSVDMSFIGVSTNLTPHCPFGARPRT